MANPNDARQKPAKKKPLKRKQLAGVSRADKNLTEEEVINYAKTLPEMAANNDSD